MTSEADAPTAAVSSLTTSLGQVLPNVDKAEIWVDAQSAVGDAVDKIIDLPNEPPSLYIDLEGTNLSRDGTLSIMQVFVDPLKSTYLFDIYTLKSAVFTTRGPKSNRSLQDVLESEVIRKVFFDVRNDSDALFSHHGIQLRGIADLQLMELAARPQDRRLLSGLAKCIKKDLGLSVAEKEAWARGKARGLALFAPERGGSYQAFDQRPLAPEMMEYCVADVTFLPRLWEVYERRLTAVWRPKLQRATEARVRESQSATYKPHGREKALAPRTLVWL